MTDLDDIEKQLSDHRRRAEASLSESVQLPEAVSARSRSEVEKLVHELRVHQIELEIQNEELKRSQAELEAGRRADALFRPLRPGAGGLLHRRATPGLILEANLTAASMLGMARSVLLKQPLTRFILSDDRDIYYRHHKQLFETQVPQVYELRMLSANAAPIWVQMDATVAKDADGVPMCRTIVSEITERKPDRRGAAAEPRGSRSCPSRGPDGLGGGWTAQRNVLIWSPENHRIFGVPDGVPMSYEFFLSRVHPGTTASMWTRNGVPPCAVSRTTSSTASWRMAGSSGCGRRRIWRLTARASCLADSASPRTLRSARATRRKPCAQVRSSSGY